ncbi:oligosaccharide flippase family protein, partial [Vibrio hyugaensis]|uniref:oligosaccharide flippase family protein n=1 Tax=Vibrio hyugaensis TaxID=1534743 RepID=UPI000CE39BD6
AIFPQWLFQGKEELGIISICRVLFQAISVPLFFVFIENANDAWKAAAIYSLPHLAIGIFSIYIIINKKWVKFTTITIDDVKDEVFRSIPLFISSAAVSIYTTTITVVLGFISSPTNVGLYAAASKIIQAFQGIYQPIAMAYYPRISKFVTESRVRAINEIIKLRNIQIVLNASISIFLYFYAELLIMLLFGSEYLEAVIVLKILSPIPFVVGLSNIYGIQTLLTFGFKKVFSRILILSAMANLLMIYPLCYAYYEIGAAISVLATELLVTVLMVFSV